jgi:hypothetical protein
VAPGVFGGLKEGYFAILQAQNIFKGPPVSTFPFLTATKFSSFGTAESLVRKN